MRCSLTQQCGSGYYKPSSVHVMGCLQSNIQAIRILEKIEIGPVASAVVNFKRGFIYQGIQTVSEAQLPEYVSRSKELL